MGIWDPGILRSLFAVACGCSRVAGVAGRILDGHFVMVWMFWHIKSLVEFFGVAVGDCGIFGCSGISEWMLRYSE